ncbi:MAG: hypothetical protein GWN18_12930 [Thermoplasmata archaeon]|nr:hypothetical protein [Thermoplasmata archaeon]NIS12959.1 hypothetical protein [Thermoplasmata archaeon]NIS20867.1 hypothetical protein [Thermoplasmata archaeon]NIT77497.1 hypothetical protein [Thermoplasmata archaeon]NIU49923.1 hypothetical protein [Thermoplasmata archaeon]
MSALDVAVLVSAMVVALVSGLYAGLGLRAESPIDRRAELWFAAFMWAIALSGAYVGGNLGIGMVNGTQVLLVAWSLLHFPNWKAVETPVPRLFPLFTLVLCLVSITVLAIGIFVEGVP